MEKAPVIEGKPPRPLSDRYSWLRRWLLTTLPQAVRLGGREGGEREGGEEGGREGGEREGGEEGGREGEREGQSVCVLCVYEREMTQHHSYCNLSGTKASLERNLTALMRPFSASQFILTASFRLLLFLRV